jgi:hypothetical protein
LTICFTIRFCVEGGFVDFGNYLTKRSKGNTFFCVSLENVKNYKTNSHSVVWIIHITIVVKVRGL